MSQKTFIFVVVLLSVLGSTITTYTASAADQPDGCNGWEADKGLSVSDIVTKYPFYSAIPGDEKARYEFCEEFLAKMKSNQNLQFVEPTYCVSNDSDLRLNSFNNCVHFDQPSSRPFSDRFNHVSELGANSIRVYELEELGNSALIYAELEPERTSDPQYPGYSLIIREQCRKAAFIPTPNRVGRPSLQGKAEYNALVRYKGNLFVYSFTSTSSQFDARPTHLKLYQFDNERVTPVCDWSYKPR